MISIVVQAKNIRTGYRRDVTDITFPLLKKINKCDDIIVSDYGSTDDTEDFVKGLKLKYVYTEPNEKEDGFLNMSKCLNNAIVNYAKYDIIVPVGTDFIFPNNFAEVHKSMYNNFNKQRREGKHSYEYLMIRTREFDFNPITYQMKKRLSSYNYSFTKKLYYLVGGYDERIVDWGGEDKCIRSRMREIAGKENIYEPVPDEIFLLHIEHPKKYENDCRKSVHKKNLQLVKENIHTRGQNIINTYYKRGIK